MLDNAKDFRYVLCPGSMPEPSFQSLYNQIYRCWREVWAEAFAELNVTKPFFSDAFTRQDYVGAIFYKDICVALAFFRWTESERREFSEDSYFSNWKTPHLKELCSRGPRIIVCSHFTVHKAGRGKTLGLSGKDLLAGMAVQTFMNSDADGMTGAVRVDRGVNGAGERWGALAIERRVPCDYGENNTDLIGFFKDHIREFPKHELHDLAVDMWNRRLVVPRSNLESQFLPQAANRLKAVG